MTTSNARLMFAKSEQVVWPKHGGGLGIIGERLLVGQCAGGSDGTGRPIATETGGSRLQGGRFVGG